MIGLSAMKKLKGLQYFKKCCEASLERSHTSKMKLFVKTVNGSQSLTIIAKGSILVVWQGSEYASTLGFNFFCKFGQI